jgi:hypothetical protein
VLVVGLLHVVFPAIGRGMRRWQYRNPDAVGPSPLFLAVSRIVGVVLAVAGVVIIVVSVA